MYRSLPSGASKPKRSLRGLEALYIQEQEFVLKPEDTIRLFAIGDAFTMRRHDRGIRTPKISSLTPEISFRS